MRELNKITGYREADTVKELNYLEIARKFLGVSEQSEDSVISSGQIITFFFFSRSLVTGGGGGRVRNEEREEKKKREGNTDGDL